MKKVLVGTFSKYSVFITILMLNLTNSIDIGSAVSGNPEHVPCSLHFLVSTRACARPRGAPLIIHDL